MIPELLGQTTRSRNSLLVEQVSQYIKEAPPKSVALAQRAMTQRRNQMDLLPMIKAKTLIMSGQEDTLIPVSDTETMAKAIAW